MSGTAQTPNSDNQVLVSRNNNTPNWKKLTGGNILDRGLTLNQYKYILNI